MKNQTRRHDIKTNLKNKFLKIRTKYKVVVYDKQFRSSLHPCFYLQLV
jgi:hypothetical protein